MLLAQTASLPQPVPPHKEKEADGRRKRLSEMLEIPQASVFNGKPAQEKAPDTVQRRRKAHVVQKASLGGPQGQLAGRKDGIGNGRAKICCAGSVKEGGEGAPPSSEMECSSAYNIFSKKRCPVWEITPPTFIVPVSAS